MLPHVISVENMRQSDAQTIANHTPSKELMRRAAQGIFDAVQFTGRIAIVCGSGNNGGDGYALACILLDHGMTPVIFRVSDKFSDDGLYYYRTARSFGAEEGNIFAPSPLAGFDIVVDCLLGTGFQGTPRDSFAHAIEEINASGAFIVSADINSGLNGDTGVAQLAVHSDVTVSIGCYKTGMFLGDAPDYIDLLVNADIGILPVRDEYKLLDWERLPLFEGYRIYPRAFQGRGQNRRRQDRAYRDHRRPQLRLFRRGLRPLREAAMRNFFQKIMLFMQGRYGMDALNGCLLILAAVIWTVNIFIFPRIPHLILMLVQLGLTALVIVRALSRNIVMRSKENRTFMRVYEPVKNWVTLTFKRIRDRRDYRYRRCPMCKAQLRVRNVKGKHRVRCPKCGSEFDTKI